MGTKNWDDLWKEAGEASGPLPVGDYDFQITGAEYKKTSGGKDMYVLKTVVVTGAYKGKMVWNNMVVSPESQPAMEVFFRQMGALGLGKEFWTSRPTDEQICARLKGAYFRGNVEAIVAQRKRMADALAGLGLTVLPSQANFVLAELTEPSATSVYEALKERKILVRLFGDWLRITIGTAEQNDALLREMTAILT